MESGDMARRLQGAVHHISANSKEAMRQSRRPQRNVFLLFLGAIFVALMTALPLVTAQTQPAPEEKNPPPAAAQQQPPQLDHPGFEQADRNKDGHVDKSEAGVVPGLSANFERADRNRDGKLDRAEFDKGLQILQVRR
jgi:EF hand